MKYLLCLVLIICFSCTKKDIVVKGNFKEKEKREIRSINLENTDQSEVYILNSDSTYTFLNSKDLSYNFGKVIATNDSTAFISVPIEKFNFLKSIHTKESKSEDIELYFYDKTGDLIPFLNIEVYRDNYKTDLLALNGLLKLNSLPDSISIPKFFFDRSRICPKLLTTWKSCPRNFSMVFAFAGDSTITRFSIIPD